VAVLIALADVGPGVRLEEQLAQVNIPAKWDASQARGPAHVAGTPLVVLVDADHLGRKLVEVTDAWRDHPAMPGVVAIGNSQVARELAPRARVTLLAPTAQPATLVEAIREAARLRLSSTMRWPVLRAALKLPPVAESTATWPATIVAARSVDLEIPRAALRWYAQHYVTPTPRLDELREERVLAVPELDAASRIDGTRTVRTLVQAGPLDPMQAVRVLWLLASLGAIDLTAEVRDTLTGRRRLLHELRAHLRARAALLEGSTYYDVLEITPAAEYPEIDAAYQLVAMRFSPDALAGHDLGDASQLLQPTWELVEKARAVLVDHAARGRYHDWLRSKAGELRTVWAIDPSGLRGAADAFARGQRSLGDGDVHRAMSELATACRIFPGHPDYEANLAWARYRVQVGSGRDKDEAAAAERKGIETMLLGRRPWPRALVPLALLCVAGNDPDSARWHLTTALAVEPTLAAAQQLAVRLGMRR
jgi:hypothetical protein